MTNRPAILSFDIKPHQQRYCVLKVDALTTRDPLPLPMDPLPLDPPTLGPFDLVCLMEYYCVYNDNMSLSIDTSRLMVFFIVQLHDLVYYEGTIIVNN